MPKLIRLLFPATMIAALCSPVFAQSDPGSLDDLLGVEFAPLQQQEIQQPSALNSPLIIGPENQVQSDALPAAGLVPVPPPPISVVETPRVDVNEPAPGELVLPDLTIPTPENTALDSFGKSTEPIELLPLDGNAVELPAERRLIRPQPQLQSPQALNYGSRVYSSRSRIQVVPIQVEFFSVSRGIGYQPYGGYGSGYGSPYGSGYRPGYGSYGRPPINYRPYGGYGRSNGGGRYCPYSR